LSDTLRYYTKEVLTVNQFTADCSILTSFSLIVRGTYKAVSYPILAELVLVPRSFFLEFILSSASRGRRGKFVQQRSAQGPSGELKKCIPFDTSRVIRTASITSQIFL